MKTALISILCLLPLTVQSGTDPIAKLLPKNEDIKEEILRVTNKCRRNVDPPACNMLEVVWNAEAEVTASNWANVCKMEHSKTSQRTLSSGIICGENMYFSSHPDSWSVAIETFYNESKDFEFEKGPKKPGAETGHYTQLVWHRSHMMACAIAYCPNQPIFKFFFVCHQCPTGNTDSMFRPYTKGEPCGMCPDKCNDKLCTNPCHYNVESSMCKDYKQFCNQKWLADSCPGTCGCKNGEIV